MNPRAADHVIPPALPLIPHLLDMLAIFGYLVGGWGVVAVVEAVRLGTPIYAMANDNWMASIGVAVLMFVAQQAGKTIRWWKKLEIQNREKDRENARLRKELAAHKESESVLRCEVERSHEANIKLREQLADTTKKLAAVQPKTPNPD
jgi:septal ring factor EnvC (AmiA/AmiB activator)